MEIRYLEKFKKQLQEIRRSILQKIKRLQKVPEFGNDTGSIDEEASETEEFATQLSIAQAYKERLADIDLALQKTEKNHYGICEKCGKEISLDILKIAPESKLCQECKKKSRRSK